MKQDIKGQSLLLEPYIKNKIKLSEPKFKKI